MDEFEELLPTEDGPMSNILERMWMMEESSRGLEEGPAPLRKRKPATLDPTYIYMREIGQSPLLSADEEVYYARLAQRGD